MKIAVLTTDTPHHRFFLQKLSHLFKIELILFETSSVEAKYDTSYKYIKKEIKFENKNFFKKIDNSIPRVKKFYYKNINNKNAINQINKLKIDIGVIFGTRKVTLDTIKAFNIKLMNVHRGIVQKYRGLDSELWAIYRGDFNNIGVTIHEVDQNLDTGNIILQKKLRITHNTKIFQLRYLTTLVATDLIIKILTNYKKNKIFNSKKFKPGKYYSFMPSSKKMVAEKKFSLLKASLKD